MEKHLKLPLSKEDIVNIKAGDMVFLTGEIYTARDAAHKIIYESIQRNDQPLAVEAIEW